MLILLERVGEAQRLAVRELKEMQAQDPRNKKKGHKRSHSGDDPVAGGKDTQESFDHGGADFEPASRGKGKNHKKSKHR